MKQKIIDIIHYVLQDDATHIDEDTLLVGENGILDSVEAINLRLQLENLAAELDFTFLWSLQANSNRNVFKNLATLVAVFERQAKQPEKT